MPLNADQLLAVIPHPVLTKIVGKPNLEVPIVLALLERNAREVGFADNIGEHRVRENRQELVGIERHRSSVSDRLYRFGADCS